MSTVDLLIRVLADTNQAQSSLSGLAGTLGKMAGVGAVGLGAAALTESATAWQTSMAKIAVAYNDTSFDQGNSRFEQVQTFLRDESTKLATSASDLAQIYQVAARYAPDSTAKAMEFTDTVARLMQVSHDLSDPTTTSQDLGKFLRIFSDTNAAGVGAAIAQLSTMHTQGESPVLGMAQNLALAGVQFGLTEAQVLGLSNVLVDAGVRVNTGGTAISRMFLQLGQAAATVGDGIDENSKKIRDAVQKIADLQEQLARTESPVKTQDTELRYQEELIKAKIQASRAGGPAVDTDALRQQMRDLKMEDIRLKPALLQSEHQQSLADQATKVSKLQEELLNAQNALADAQQPGKTRGINIGEAAKLAGMPTTDFAEFFQTDAFGAFTAMIGGLKDLPKNEQASELGKLGIKNVRDIQNIEALAAKFDTIAPNVSAAQQQITTPTTLGSESGIMLDTTAAKLKDAADSLQVAASIVGEPLRKGLDEVLTSALDVVRTTGFDPLVRATQDLTNSFGDLDKVLAVAAGLQLLGGVGGLAGGAGSAASLLGKGGQVATAAGAAGAQVTTAGSAVSSVLAGAGTVGGVAAATALPFVLADAWKMQHGDSAVPDISSAGTAFGEHHPIGVVAPPTSSSPQPVNVGGVTINVPGLSTDWGSVKDDVLKTVVAQFSAAWNAAMNGHPVSNGMGGNYSSRGGPR